MTQLSKQVTMYIGIKYDQDKNELEDDLVAEVLNDLSANLSLSYGGCTIHYADGRYDYQPEDVAVVTTVCSDDLYDADHLYNQTQLVCERLNQGSVLVTVENVVAFLVKADG